MIVMRSKDQFEAHVEGDPIGTPHKTLAAAEAAYVTAMATKGVTVDPRTLIVVQYMPHEPVYKMLRIR